MRPYAPPPQSCTGFSTRRQFSLTQSGQYESNVPAPPFSNPRMRYQVPSFVGNDRLQAGARAEMRPRSGVNQPIHTTSKRSKKEDFSSWLQKDEKYCLSSKSLPAEARQPDPATINSNHMKSSRLLFESTEYCENESAADRYAYLKEDSPSTMHESMGSFSTQLCRTTSASMRGSGAIPQAPQSARGYRPHSRSFSISSDDGSSLLQPNPTLPQFQSGVRGGIPNLWQPNFLPRESSAERIARVRREASLESRKRFALEREAAKAAAIAREEARQKYLEIQMSMRTTQRDRILLARDKVEKDVLILTYALIVIQYYHEKENEFLEKIRQCGLQDFRRLSNLQIHIFEEIDHFFIKEMENVKISKENLQKINEKFQQEKQMLTQKLNFIEEFQHFLKEKNFNVNDGICDELKDFVLINEYGIEIPRL
jgi:hypothetical protein